MNYLLPYIRLMLPSCSLSLFVSGKKQFTCDTVVNWHLYFQIILS